MITIRAAALDDLGPLSTLDRACFARAWTPVQWRSELLPSGQVRALVLIAHDDRGRPVAHACASIVFERCELRRIGVIAELRGRGIGRDLIARVIDHARISGCTVLELEVASTNLAALALYQRIGFHRVGVRPNYYLDPPADALLMDLDLRGESPF